jgi:hypothetical protein
LTGSRFCADDYELASAKPVFDGSFAVDEGDREARLPYESSSFDVVIGTPLHRSFVAALPHPPLCAMALSRPA